MQLSLICTAGYIKDFEVFEPHRVGRITVELEGRIKDCKALSYRQDIRAKDIESYKSRILPTRQV
jgi:small subunit ribosomal protein S15Ae